MSVSAAGGRELEISRTFDASPGRLWKAWTDPVVMARWLHPHGLHTAEETVAVDLRVGGAFRFSMVDTDGESFASGGEYLELREPEVLRFTWGAPGAPVAEIEVRLAPLHGGRTAMTFRLRGAADDTGRDDSVWTGWREAIAELRIEMGETHG